MEPLRKADLVSKVINGLSRAGFLSYPVKGIEKPLCIGGRSKQVCCFKYAGQLVGADHGDIFTTPPLNDHHLPVMGHLI